MIHEQDLRDAIAECQGKRNPDANTCIKLAAYFTILNSMYPEEHQIEPAVPIQYYQMESGNSGTIDYNSETEFGKAIHGRNISDVMPVFDELMTAIKVLHPRLYDGVMNKL